MSDSLLRRTRTVATLAALLLAVPVLASCSSTGGTATEAASPSTSAAASGSEPDATPASEVVDDSHVHEITVTFDEDDYDAMIETYSSSGDKDWISATVTIDGETYDDVGLRLKGNSSLGGLRGRGMGPGGEASADEPERLPWLIRFDKYVEGQHHHGLADLVIRSNRSETSLNEAVALELLERAGLASQDAMPTSFAVNGSDPALRLAIEHPDDGWVEEWFGTGGSLYKAESTGDYSYRGDDPEAYDEVFDLEAGDDEELEHLVDFLQFVNEADDETFAAELPERFDVDAFATYLAMQELLDNFDDIDGPGNNSYLYFDPETGKMVVVPWDMNLAFGAGGKGFPGGPPGGLGGNRDPRPRAGLDAGPAGELPQGGPAGARGRGPEGTSNVLVERFLADSAFSALYEEQLDALREELFESGVADEVLDTWVTVLREGAADLVEPDVVAAEAERIAASF